MGTMGDKPIPYWVVVTVKNGETTIKQSIESILAQTISPTLICIVDDGSVDNTPEILSKIRENHKLVHVITLPDKGYDSRRIVHNWNVACDYIKNRGDDFEYYLTGTDDVVFQINYVERLIEKFNEDPNLVVVSGSRGLEASDYLLLPEGAGRLVRMSYFKKIGFHYPPFYGYESWILYKALQLGYKVLKVNDLKYEHLRKFGVGHKFIEYGPAMRCLGYHPLFVLARVLRNLVVTKTGISKSASIRMFFDFLFESKWRDDPYFHYFEPELREFVRNLQKNRLSVKLGF